MTRGAVIVIGIFDGVHRGHQAVLEAGARLARARGFAQTLLTFEPHPAVTLGREPPPLLTAPERKRELLLRSCPELNIVVRAFDSAFSAQSPEEFAERVLARELDARLVMVGHNFRFGRGRTGGLDELVALGARLGFEALAEPLVSDESGAWSSTRLRELIATGDVGRAMQLLGRPHMVSGTVVHGERRGHAFGFPTCNLAAVAEALPADGVYAIVVDRVVGGVASALAKGVCNIGVRPTIGDRKTPLLEAHLFDICEDLYDAKFRVHFIEHLRPEQRFGSLEQLRDQIAKDSTAARIALSAWEPDEAIRGAWA